MRIARVKQGAAALSLAALLLAAGAVYAADAKQKEYTASNFKIEIDGLSVTGITSVGGTESQTDIVEYKDGDNGTTQRRPGQVKYGNITLTRIFSKADALRSWYEDVLAGKDERKSVSIIYLNDAGQEVMRYNLSDVWPCRWSMPALDSKNSGHATEKISLCMDNLVRQ